MNNDTSSYMHLIQARNDGSMAKRMLDIYRYKESREQLTHWRNDLRLLFRASPHERRLTSTKSGGNEQAGYIAISYPWAHSRYEDSPSFSWQIETDNSTRSSEVRDTILDRAREFMDHENVLHLWIDAECISQGDVEERQRIMKTMHLVYANSYCSLALLFVPIRTLDELDALERLLSGKLVRTNPLRKRSDQGYDKYVLAAHLLPEHVSAILDLILHILSDEWWSRAWCFQEEYVSLSEMQLLLPTLFEVSKRKASHSIDFLNRDISISARRFKMTVTHFMFAYEATTRRNAGSLVFDKVICHQILQKAGYYRFIAIDGDKLGLDIAGKAMSTQILTNISRRRFTRPPDLIHISANCNLYPWTLQTWKLDREGSSLALSIIALFFMNGEIFKNGIKDSISATDAGNLNVFEYLNAIAFDGFHMPGGLASLRRHRFVEPSLMKHGVQCTGILWKIDRVVQLPSSWRHLLWSNGILSNIDSEDVVELFDDIQYRLRRFDNQLSKRIARFLDKLSNPDLEENSSASAIAMSHAAFEVARELLSGKKIGLGHIIDDQNDPDLMSDKRGVFAIGRNVTRKNPVYAFTAWQAGVSTEEIYEGLLMDEKQVSLQVDIDDWQNEDGTPSLCVKSWIQGLCFWYGVKSRKVTFPWPPSLSHAHNT